MSNPTIRILLVLFSILVAIGIYLWATGAPPLTALLMPIGAIFGPFMALAYPFSATFKIGYILALLTSLLVAIVGIKKRNLMWGQALVVLGVVGWSACGLIGLGTGT